MRVDFRLYNQAPHAVDLGALVMSLEGLWPDDEDIKSLLMMIGASERQLMLAHGDVEFSINFDGSLRRVQVGELQTFIENAIYHHAQVANSTRGSVSKEAARNREALAMTLAQQTDRLVAEAEDEARQDYSHISEEIAYMQDAVMRGLQVSPEMLAAAAPSINTLKGRTPRGHAPQGNRVVHGRPDVSTWPTFLDASAMTAGDETDTKEETVETITVQGFKRKLDI